MFDKKEVLSQETIMQMKEVILVSFEVSLWSEVAITHISRLWLW